MNGPFLPLVALRNGPPLLASILSSIQDHRGSQKSGFMHYGVCGRLGTGMAWSMGSSKQYAALIEMAPPEMAL